VVSAMMFVAGLFWFWGSKYLAKDTAAIEEARSWRRSSRKKRECLFRHSRFRKCDAIRSL